MSWPAILIIVGALFVLLFVVWLIVATFLGIWASGGRAEYVENVRLGHWLKFSKNMGWQVHLEDGEAIKAGFCPSCGGYIGRGKYVSLTGEAPPVAMFATDAGAAGASRLISNRRNDAGLPPCSWTCTDLRSGLLSLTLAEYLAHAVSRLGKKSRAEGDSGRKE